MAWIARICSGLFALGLGAAPVLADSHRPAALAIWSAETCLRLGDAAFEHGMSDELAEADQAALEQVFSTATFECLGLSMEMCEGRAEGDACLSDLANWVRDTRAEIVASLPDVEDDAYARALERAAAADEANCEHMSDAERERYCAVVAEGMALEDAYGAWRLARREGAMALEGHDPVDLELIR